MDFVSRFPGYEDITNIMGQTATSEGNNFLSGGENIHILWNPKFHYRLNNSWPLFPVFKADNRLCFRIVTV